MPVTPSPQIPTDRRASSPKRDTDVLPTKGHVVTKTAFNQVVHSADAQANLRVKRACEFKNLMLQAFRIAGAEESHYQKIVADAKEGADMSKEKKLRNEWRKCRRQAQHGLESVPLQVENK